jgi:nucleotide-binding universal stress UspA family protein
MHFQEIVVAVDFSKPSLLALPIHLVHALDGRPGSVGAGASEKESAPRARAKLFQLAESALDEPGTTPLQAHVVEGRPAESVLARARTLHADLIVVGAHARGRVERVVLGSVSEELARISEIPVLIVRETVGGGGTTERVLVAVDETPHSRLAVRTALALAKRLGTRVEGVRVLDVSPDWIAEKGGQSRPSFQDDVPADVVARAGLALPSSTVALLGGSVRYAVGEPGPVISRMATSQDVVVCGTHGRSGLGRLAFGSVATKLTRNVPCPILVVRPSTEPAKTRRHRRAKG